jgi:hypothetical protein
VTPPIMGSLNKGLRAVILHLGRVPHQIDILVFARVRPVPAPGHLTYPPAPTPPRGRTWAPVVDDVGAKADAESTPIHSHPARPRTQPTWHLGRALLGARSRLIHLAPQNSC